MNVKKNRMMGVLLPHHLISHLALYSLLTKTTRTKIVRACIQHWYNAQKMNTSTKQLALELSKLYQMEWNELPDLENVNFTLYTQNIREVLIHRGVEPMYIDIIIANLKP